MDEKWDDSISMEERYRNNPASQYKGHWRTLVGMEPPAMNDKPYDWKNHVDLAPYSGLKVPLGSPLEKAQEALMKAEYSLRDMGKLIYADHKAQEPKLMLREPMPATICITVGPGKSVTLKEDEHGYFHAAGNCDLTEAAQVFFDNVIAHAALELGRQRRELAEVRRERDDLLAAKAREREACVPEHLIPDWGVRGF